MIHYHGTPVTPRERLYDLAGRSFCVSFADPRDVGVAHAIGQSVMLDNGAFTFWRDKKRPHPGWPAYYEWAAPWLDHWTTWAVIPDVIDGDEAANDALIAEWPFGHRGAPVWHLHESLIKLDRLCSEWPLICIGSSGGYATLGTPEWCRRMATAMTVACDEGGRARTRLHMLRGLALSRGPYPLFSADSSNIARNHARQARAKRPETIGDMAHRIDCAQPPALWSPT